MKEVQARVYGLIEKAYTVLIFGGNLLQPIILLTFRLIWGWGFFVSGKGKLANHDDIVSFFKDLGIPAPDLNAWFVGGVECVGGLLLLIGLLSRPTALVLAVNMTVAYLTAEREKVLNLFSKPEPQQTSPLDAFLQADPFFYWLTAILILAFGPGPLSADNLIRKFFIDRAKRGSVGEATSPDKT